MNQADARRRAKELGGVAIGARRSPTTGRWILGGWASQKSEEWIVVSSDRSAVLDDGGEWTEPS